MFGKRDAKVVEDSEKDLQLFVGQAGRGDAHVEVIIKIVDNGRERELVAEYPFDGIGHSVKDNGAGAEAKG